MDTYMDSNGFEIPQEDALTPPPCITRETACNFRNTYTLYTSFIRLQLFERPLETNNCPFNRHLHNVRSESYTSTHSNT